MAGFYELSRSGLLRDMIDKFIGEYAGMARVLANKKLLKSPISKTWLNMCGSGKTSAKNVSLNVDEIYLKDSTDD